MENNDEYLSVKKAASMLGVCNDTIRRWAREGVLSVAKTAGGHRRFRKQDIEDYVNRPRHGLERPYLKLTYVCDGLEWCTKNEITTVISSDSLRDPIALSAALARAVEQLVVKSQKQEIVR